MRKLFLLPFTILLTACTVGPNYVRPSAPIPDQYKEAPKGWKHAQPQDAFNKGEWWKIFNDPQLNALEEKVAISNQSIKSAEENYQQALQLVNEARASYFPTVTGTAAVTRQRVVATSGASFNSSGSASSVYTDHSLQFGATWAPDIWGLVRRTVEASAAGAQASEALLAATRLSSQGLLAQDYFELRALDRDQKLLDDTVLNYAEALKLTKYQYASGVAARSDIVQAESQLEVAKAQAINNHIARAQSEHAMAVLIGVPAGSFSMPVQPLHATPPRIPLEVPSALLERRPDIAQAERQVAQANANIGVAITAYFPTLTLSGTAGTMHNGLENWFSIPALNWSVGPQLAETLFDGGLRSATVAAARATYEADVASYRQTVLAAFQNVEDNLVSVRVLKEQSVQQDKAAESARTALQLIINEYKSGTVAYSSVVTAQINAFSAEKSAADIYGQRMTSAVGLIMALGGGWNSADL